MPRARARPDHARTQLNLGRPPERLAGLLRAHDQLLERIARKKKELARFDEQARTLTASLAASVGPLLAACSALDDEIHGLFAKLLSPGRLSARSRKQVARLYSVLMNDGVLTERDESVSPVDTDNDNDDDHDEAAADGDEDAWAGDPGDPQARNGSPSGAGGFTAARPGGKGPIDSLRGLYRRLASAIHPDKVQDDAERLRRTEIMKEVTRAYGAGDLARLLEIERLWSTNGGAPLDQADDVTQRCATLERVNDELRGQLRALDAKLREARRSPHGDLVRHHRSGGDPVGDLVADAEDERAQLAAIRDHVQAFERKKISLADFLAGPLSPIDPEEYLRQAAEALADLDNALADLDEGARPKRRRSRSGRR